jgi:hypothetical protein
MNVATDPPGGTRSQSRVRWKGNSTPRPTTKALAAELRRNAAGTPLIYRLALVVGSNHRMATIPAQELWLFSNQAALASINRGLEQLRSGDTHYIGTFDQYADAADE